ncbi:MAG: VWA domain-containing protein [Polyangia bacterium]
MISTIRESLLPTAALLAGLVALSPGNAAAASDSVRLDVSLGTPLVLSGATRTAYLKVGLTGFPLEGPARRTPVNASIVIDRSGSMSGQKMRKAREAAHLAVDRLGDDDIVSVVTYNHGVQVLVPATKVRNRAAIHRRIERMIADGNTALFAGVSKGAHEVRKFLAVNRVNRVILVSDGLANVGPSSPGELGRLGASLAKEGVSVSTIGLGRGYNEDLMVALARSSDGNHAFAENGVDLVRIFDYEFGDMLSVVAREVEVTIRCSPGVEPVRVLGRPAQIAGDTIFARLNQITSEQEKFLLVELRIPASAEDASREVASVDVRYANSISRTTDVLGGSAVVGYSDSPDEVRDHRNEDVLAASVELIANETNKYAVELRDQGRIAEARGALEQNARFLERNARGYESKKAKKKLEKRAKSNRNDMKNMDQGRWKRQRKVMRDSQFELDMQQAY